MNQLFAGLSPRLLQAQTRQFHATFPSAPTRNQSLLSVKASPCSFLGHSGVASVIAIQD